MIDLIHLATSDLVTFLNNELPALSPDWWDKHVIRRLSFQQQRTVQERGYNSLYQLDFAGVLRIFDQNWHELSGAISLPYEGRTWIKELQSVRNRWAHLSAETIPPSEIYRDADTLSRLLTMIGAPQTSVDTVESRKQSAVKAMANRTGSPQPAITNGLPAHTATEVSSLQAAPAQQQSVSLFRAGDLVALRSNPKVAFPILDVITGEHECRYQVFQNNGRNFYYESQLQAMTVTDERKTLTALELQARLTSLQILSPSTANLFSLRSGRVQFVPYQYRPVLKLIRSDRPRLLIADEVGVGKTIEAGLIIKELRARMNLTSVLIICPKALVSERKWYLEMKRFDETFTPLDGQLLRHCLQETHIEGEWPEQYAKSILPFSLFDSNLLYGGTRRGANKHSALINLDPPPKFDLVIVDEAHHIRNSETYLHQGVRYFCDNAEAVLFLTATPVQLGSRDLYTLLNVLRSDLVIDHVSFEQMAEPNPHINAAVKHCRQAEGEWQQEALNSLENVISTEWGRLFLRESPSFQQVYDILQGDPVADTDRVGLIRTIEELYTFSSLINRTRRRDIGEFTTRKPQTITIDFTPSQQRLHDNLLDVLARILSFCHGQQNVKFMMTTVRRQAASCLYGLAPLLQNMLVGKVDQMEFQVTSGRDDEINLEFVNGVRDDITALIERTRTLDMHDPKVEAFVNVLRDKSKLDNNKALVFSTFRHTLAYLAQNMTRTDMRFGLIHGDVPDEERASLRRRFALPKENSDAIDVLLSSEVGCEGLDFQFCDFLINYDLPWNPMRIEQRIGRIDRYGQKSPTVAIVNLITPGTVDADIYTRCLLRIGVFQHAIGGNEEILGEITTELRDITESFTLTPVELEKRIQQLTENGIRRIQEEQDLESKQAELFGLDVPNPSWEKDIQAAENFWLSSSAIRRCASAYLMKRLNTGADPLLGEKTLQTLRLSQEARIKLLEDYRHLPRSIEPIAKEWEKWLKGGQPTLSVTFDQETAAENPHTVHLSVLHPLVRQAAHYLQINEPFYTSLSVQTNEIAFGNYHFALYRWKKCGVKPDEILVPVASDSAVEGKLLLLLHTATESDLAMLPNQDVFDQLDSQQHSKWAVAQANHIADNREQVEYRIQSLTASHKGRCKALDDKIAAATNNKIQLMRQSELARAESDFSQHMAALTTAANSGDIHTSPVIFGTLNVIRSANK